MTNSRIPMVTGSSGLVRAPATKVTGSFRVGTTVWRRFWPPRRGSFRVKQRSNADRKDPDGYW